MATRKPKVGDPAIIDGGPAVITALDATTVEFQCLERVAFMARLAEIRALPTDTEEERKKAQQRGQAGPLEAAKNAAKEDFMASHQAALDKVGDEKERVRLVNNGHSLPGGTTTKASPGQLMWIEYSDAWSCHGRLLSRADIVKVDKNGDDVMEVNDDGDETGQKVFIQKSVRRIAKGQGQVVRKLGHAYDPAAEIAAHIAHVSTNLAEA